VIRRAAGRTDGRPWTPSALVLAAAVVGALPATPGHAAPAGDGGGDSRPVHIAVSRLEPRTVTPGAPIELSGTLVNDGAETYTDLSVRLQRGDLLPTRARLAADRAEPDEANTATAPFLPVPGDLAPGKTVNFTYTTTADVLHFDADGVYPLLVNLNGSRGDGTPQRVGELSTHVVVEQPTPATRTTVAWLWPITDRPHRDARGGFTDDELAGEVADGGRLDRAVDVLEQAGPAVPATLVVDPALLEELSTMAAGPYTTGSGAGTGTARAADLLARLRRLSGQHPVVALGYADVDTASLVAAGQSAVVSRSLPGGAGAAIVHDVLGVQPRTDLAWPAGGASTPAAVDALQADGIGTVVLADAGLSDGGRAVGAEGAPAAAGSTLPAAAGVIRTLVADSRLTDVVAGATPSSGQGRLVEQDYLAELGALTSQLADRAPGGQQTVLVAPPRRVDPDPAVVAAMMADTTGQPWLAAAAADSLAAGPQTGTGQLVADTGGLPADGLGRIVQSAQVRDDFAAAVVGDPHTVLARYDAAIARAASVEWRDAPEAFAASAADLQRTVGALRNQVTLLSPVNGTYTLGSSDAPLVLTVRNDLPFAVDVRLELRTRDNVRLTTDDIGVTRLEPSSITPLKVQAHVQQSGGFAVTARLTTPAGGPLGNAVQMQVKSTAYGSVTLGITIGAAALLGLLFLRRAVNFVLKRRRGEPAPDVLDDVSAVPPTRSPV
jgi:Family of unknown function (DUF6049)